MSSLKNFIATFYKKLSPVATFSNTISTVALAAMMFLTAIDVVGRKVFNSPLMGTYEITQLLMAILVSLGIAHCGIKKGHVNIDLVLMRLPRRTQGILGIITGLFALFIIAIAAWQTGVNASMQVRTGLTTPVLMIPMFPFIAIVAFGLTMYFIVLIIHWLEYIQEGTNKKEVKK